MIPSFGVSARDHLQEKLRIHTDHCIREAHKVKLAYLLTFRDNDLDTIPIAQKLRKCSELQPYDDVLKGISIRTSAGKLKAFLQQRMDQKSSFIQGITT